jgi:protein O-GlcNAc transferase
VSRALLAILTLAAALASASVPPAHAATGPAAPSAPQAAGTDAFAGGIDALGRGDYPAAEDAFRAVLAKEPRNLEAMLRLGGAYLGEGRLREAFSTLQTLRVLAPDDPRVHLYLGQVYYQAGLPQRERDALLEAIRLKPDFPEAHLQLAHALAVAGELYAASAEYAWLIDRAEEAGRTPQAPLLFNLGVLRSRLDHPEEAIGLLERFLAATPTGEQADWARAELPRLKARVEDRATRLSGPPAPP